MPKFFRILLPAVKSRTDFLKRSTRGRYQSGEEDGGVGMYGQNVEVRHFKGNLP